MHRFPRAQRRVLVVACLISLSATLFASIAHPQGVTATAKPVASSTSPEVAAMKRRIDELERRVLELEKQKADEVEADEEDDAATKKLEQRLAAVEREQKSDDAADKSSKSKGDDESASRGFDPLNVRAPFIVRDDDGKVLLRVDRSQAGYARLMVGDLLGTRVVLSSAAGQESAVELTDTSNKVKVRLRATASIGELMAGNERGMTQMGLSKDGTPSFQVMSAGQTIIAEMRGLPDSQSGQLILSNSSGVKLVMAGENAKGVGIVKLGPNGNGPAAVMGNMGLPASSIQAK